MKDKLKQLPKRLWPIFTHNIGLKLLALLFAVLLWSYVVTTNPSITRNKTIVGLSAYINGQATLNAYRLALSNDPGSALNGITVTLEVPQAEYAFASPDNVQVMLDLTTVRSTGTQDVPLRATTTYGKVLRVIPDSLTLNFESLDSRSVPVNVTLDGASENRWYSKSRVNPQQLTISGAASVVQRISSANVAVDVADRSENYTTAVPYTLYDTEGNEISQAMLDCSASSITVGLEIYPTRELPVSNSVEDVLTGQPAEGYVVESISIQPETVTVAAEQDLLDSLAAMLVEPIDVSGMSQSFSRRVALSKLADIKYSSAEQVYVSVQIAEETATERIEKVRVAFVGQDDGLSLSWVRAPFAVRATGPRSEIEELMTDGIDAVVDLTGLAAGSYDLALTVPEESYPGITFEMETPTVSVTLEAAGD